MRDLFSMLAEPDPEPAPALKSPAIRESTVALPCPRVWSGNPNGRCSVGGGDGPFSADDGRTWACRVHVPWGFFPADRG